MKTDRAASTRRILLLGANGQLGTELKQAFADHNLVALDRTAADLSRLDSLRAIVRETAPSVILNAAAYTAVDRAESEPRLADTINHQAPRVLAEEAERSAALLVHYSTDYVFDGSKLQPWDEADPPHPLNVYGASKLAGERAIASSCPRHLILRTSWVYAAHGHNFLRTMLRLGREKSELKIVNDQQGAPTSASALAHATRLIADRWQQEPAPENLSGIYHATCSGTTSWCGFAQAIFDQAAAHDPGPWASLVGIPTSDYPTPARRPHNSALSNQKLHDHFDVRLPAWQNALQQVLDQMRS